MRTALTLAGFVLVLGGLAGCGGSDSDGGDGDSGGNGQGGGIFNGAGSTVELTQSLVVHNRARSGDGSPDGRGEGGGVFNDPAGRFDVDAFTLFWIRFNNASDDGDNVFGPLTLI